MVSLKSILPLLLMGIMPRNLHNSLAIFSASFSHQFFVGQKMSTAQPVPMVSRLRENIPSSSWPTSYLRSKFFTSCNPELKRPGPTFTNSVRGMGRKFVLKRSASNHLASRSKFGSVALMPTIWIDDLKWFQKKKKKLDINVLQLD